MMGRGPRWTDAENQTLQKMMEQGMSAEGILKAGIFPNRTFRSIKTQMERLSFAAQKKKTFVPQIREAEIIDLETIVRRFVDAFNKVCDLKEARKEVLERYRIIFSAARTYFDLYFRLEEFSEVKSRVERLEATVAQLEAEKKTENPQQAA